MSPSDPNPPHEAGRSQALADLGPLDAAAAPGLEAIVRVAARTFSVPIALVALVDGERTRFVARQGLAVHEAGRAGSFTDVAVQSDAVSEIGDATLDARVAGGPLVSGSVGARSYVGAPLVLPDGRRVGALELIDVRPRTPLTTVERATLADLAAVAVELLVAGAWQRALEASVRAAERLGAHDPSTGALHRRGLTERLEQALSLARRGDGVLPVLAFDLAGVETGDEPSGPTAGAGTFISSVREAMRVAAVQRLRAGVRDHDLVAHLGGGAFVVVLQAARHESAHEVATRLLADLERPVEVPGVGMRSLHPSVGLAAYPDDGEDAVELLAAADRARHDAERVAGGATEAERG